MSNYTVEAFLFVLPSCFFDKLLLPFGLLSFYHLLVSKQIQVGLRSAFSPEYEITRVFIEKEGLGKHFLVLLPYFAVEVGFSGQGSG